MTRRNFTVPLLIGGATTSRQHTAVKIAPEYSGPVVHVLDASRAVDVVSNLLGSGRPAFDSANRAEQADIRAKYASRRERPMLSYEQARANRLQINWDDHEIASPWFLGRRVLDELPLEELAKFIDWTFFFSAWELKGRFPGILQHPQYGAAARELYEHATTLLKKIIDEKLLTARGVYAFWPASADGDDILVYADDSRRARARTLPDASPAGGHARPAAESVAGRLHRASGIGSARLPWHVRRHRRHRRRRAGAQVRAGSRRLQRDHGEGACRPAAEASAEYLHLQVRKDWGYGEQEHLSLDDVIGEKFRGIRPAYGYPACPDHSEKFKLFNLLEAPKQGITLTEHAAMLPAASVSGLYFSHPEAKYFNVGRLGRDQMESYAQRKGKRLEDVEKWLGPNLAYDPSTLPVVQTT